MIKFRLGQTRPGSLLEHDTQLTLSLDRGLTTVLSSAGRKQRLGRR